MTQYSQDNRSISISDFTLGPDTFLLTSFSGSEFISDCFKFQLNVLSENHDIKAEQVVGKNVTISFNNKQKRFFNGFISHFNYNELAENGLRQYSLTMVPWLWFAKKTNNYRIFQNKTTKDIVSEIFSELGFSDFTFKAQGGSNREYCVQHDESDFHFISRLLEEEGIAYFFKHDETKHQMQLVEQANAYEEVVETDLIYTKGDHTEPYINSWDHQYNFRKGQWTINDYNFNEPDKNNVSNVKTNSTFSNNAKYEHYQYPDIYAVGLGADLAKIRMEAEEVSINSVIGKSDCSSFYAGGKFKLAQHVSKTEKGSYIIVAIQHSATEFSYFQSDGNSKTSDYNNSFRCIPADVQYRPNQRHSRPVMKGPQSALVVGPAGEEIFIDDLGRIKVQFIWDRDGQKNENSTCFIRVMQSWAGNGWGSSFIPRIGHEVIVTFLDGDPDRPIITGTVYNGKNKPVYSSKTQSGIKSHSTKQGGADNYNELRFEDKKGNEQVFIQAEKDLDTNVKNDESLMIGNNRSKSVGQDEIITIGNDQTKTVNNNEVITIEKDRNKTVKNNQTEAITVDKTITVGGKHTESIDKDKSLTISGKHLETIIKDMIINVDGDLKESVKGQYSESVTKEYDLKAKKITMTADDEIIIKTGSAFIKMKKNGDILIQGKKIDIKGSGNITIKGTKTSVN